MSTNNVTKWLNTYTDIITCCKYCFLCTVCIQFVFLNANICSIEIENNKKKTFAPKFKRKLCLVFLHAFTLEKLNIMVTICDRLFSMLICHVPSNRFRFNIHSYKLQMKLFSFAERQLHIEFKTHFQLSYLPEE